MPPPTRPMQVARDLVADVYTFVEGYELHEHRGDFYHYDGKCWPEIDGREVRAKVYRWLEDTVYEKETEKGADTWCRGTRLVTRCTTCSTH